MSATSAARRTDDIFMVKLPEWCERIGADAANLAERQRARHVGKSRRFEGGPACSSRRMQGSSLLQRNRKPAQIHIRHQPELLAAQFSTAPFGLVKRMPRTPAPNVTPTP